MLYFYVFVFYVASPLNGNIFLDFVNIISHMQKTFSYVCVC